jgi:hypothetical protein
MEKNINNLRVIKTLHGFDDDTINSYIYNGYKVLIRMQKIGSKLWCRRHIIQDKETNELHIVGIFPQSYSHLKDYGCIRSITQMDATDDENCRYKVLEYIPCYNKSFDLKRPYAAYLIPPDIKVNEKVFIADLIEEVTYDYISRLESCEAVWDGKDLNIIYDKSRIGEGVL